MKLNRLFALMDTPPIFALMDTPSSGPIASAAAAASAQTVHARLCVVRVERTRAAGDCAVRPPGVRPYSLVDTTVHITGVDVDLDADINCPPRSVRKEETARVTVTSHITHTHHIFTLFDECLFLSRADQKPFKCSRFTRRN